MNLHPSPSCSLLPPTEHDDNVIPVSRSAANKINIQPKGLVGVHEKGFLHPSSHHHITHTHTHLRRLARSPRGLKNPLAGSGNCRLFSEPEPINIVVFYLPFTSLVPPTTPSAAQPRRLSFPERISRLKKYHNNDNISFLFPSPPRVSRTKRAVTEIKPSSPPPRPKPAILFAGERENRIFTSLTVRSFVVVVFGLTHRVRSFAV